MGRGRVVAIILLIGAPACSLLIGLDDIERVDCVGDRCDSGGETTVSSDAPDSIDAPEDTGSDVDGGDPCATIATPAWGPLDFAIVDGGPDAVAFCDGSSVLIKTSPLHCGECDHPCAVGCTNGTCDPEIVARMPTNDAGTFQNVEVQVIDDSGIYGVSSYAWRADPRGSIPSVAVRLDPEDAGAVEGIRTDDAELYFDSLGRICATAKDGLGPCRIVVPQNVGFYGWDLGSTKVFWFEQNQDAAVHFKSKDSGPAQNILDEPLDAVEIRAEGEVVWVITSERREAGASARSRLVRYDALSGSIARTDELSTASGLTIDERYVYVYAGGKGEVLRFPKSAPSGKGELVARLDVPEYYAWHRTYVDARHLYFGLGGIDSTRFDRIVRVPKCGGAPAIVFGRQGAFHTAVVGDDQHVYWGNQAGALVRAPK